MKKLGIIISIILVIAVVAVIAVGCASFVTEGRDYTIRQLDLSADVPTNSEYAELYETYLIDDGSDYMAHPDAITVDRDGDGVRETLMAMYPEGHGKGAVLTKESTDGGKTWGNRRTDTPSSWKDSKETPTVYRLDFNNEPDRLVMISANPSWNKGHGDGFNASYSKDEGKTWTEFQKYYGWKQDGYVDPIVAMASLTRLKDGSGNWIDSWMGFFHDYDFVNYKSILTFEGDQMKWSKPEAYFSAHRKIEKGANMCEVEVIRSDNGQGSELCLIGRANSKDSNSIISFSQDEGKTWSEPKEVAAALSGERHKADYIRGEDGDDNRLVITFRSIERSKAKLKNIVKAHKGSSKWFSEGWIAWVGTYEDLKGMYTENGSGKTEGAFRIKMAHTYFENQTRPYMAANGDTGYCGNAVLDDGTYFTSSYGTFGQKTADGSYKTYIVGKRINFSLLDEYIMRG